MIKKLLKGILFIAFILALSSNSYAFTPPTAAYDDPPDAYTKLQLSFDEADGSTTTDDESASNYTITNNGNVQTDSAQTKFSNTSLFDGTGDFWTAPDNADWNFGTSDWTVDYWVRFTDPINDAEIIVGQYAAAANKWHISQNATRVTVILRIGDIGLVNIYGSVSLNPTTWYHIAVARSYSGNLFYVWVDGVAKTITYTTGSGDEDFGDVAATLNIGYTDADLAFSGNMDELRISVGIVRDWASARRIILIVKWWKNFYWKYLRS